MSAVEREQFANVIAELARRDGEKFRSWFPDSGPLGRAHYAKHVAFFAAGATYPERLFMKANRVGGSESGAYELTAHATGLYPAWWTGRRFTTPIDAWACGTNSETTRDIVQVKLCGSLDIAQATKREGGMLPAHLIVHASKRTHGLAGSLESLWVRHVSGGTSVIGLKTYEQGREAFEGTAKHVIWCDEEPPEDCYTEMLYRTVTTQGIVMTTFTPLKGRSRVVNGFLEPETEASREFKFYIQVGWDDVPHLDDATKRHIIATTPPFQVAARTQGEPSLGSGAVYPIPESEIRIKDFTLGDKWPRVLGLDGARSGFTAAVWLALDRETGTKYCYSVYKRSGVEVPIHASAIKSRGAWIPGVGDLSAVAKADGTQYLKLYQDEGLDVVLAEKAVETGVQDVWAELSTGRLKVFASCEPLFQEYRAYHRNEQGVIVKENDHVMDALRYAVRGKGRMIPPPSALKRLSLTPTSRGGWMA